MSFGKILRELRKRENMTQEQLAQQLAISPQAVSRWENDFTMPDISLVVPIARIFDVPTDVLLGCQELEFDLDEVQRFDGKDAFREGLRGLVLINTVYACEMAEKILELVFEDGNYLDFHELWVHVLTTKARLLKEEGRYEESVEALRKAQYHSRELDKVKFRQPHTSKIFEGITNALPPQYQTHCNLYHLNTVIVYDQGNLYHSDSKYYQELVEEIKAKGTYCKNERDSE